MCCIRNESVNIAETSIDYFKEESQETGIPYQVLIDLYLADCVKSGKSRKSPIFIFKIIIDNSVLMC